MNVQKADLVDKIDWLATSDMPFAFYRRAGETEVHCVVQTSGKAECLSGIRSLGAYRGFVMAPFDTSGKDPLMVIRPDCVTVGALDEVLDMSGFRSWKKMDVESPVRLFVPDSGTGPDERYTKCMQRFLDGLHNGRFQKLVLSRCESMDGVEGLSVGTVFRKACMYYPDSYVYVCGTHLTGIWIGATPEILLASESQEWRTMALAGTQPLERGQLPVCWREKNREEQACVADYIRRILEKKCVDVIESGPYGVRAGELAHLRTDFRFRLSADRTPEELLESLHPTPAVCGMPKEDAWHFIRQEEGYDRSYYSGFTGCWRVNGQTDLYVNLRCMQLDSGRVKLYAGGGILASSELTDEWNETVRKMRTMRILLADAQDLS